MAVRSRQNCLPVTAGRVAAYTRAAWSGQEPEEANADETTRQCMQQAAAQKLVRGDRHLPFLVAVRVVLPSKGDRLAIKRNQPVIGDGHSMRVPGQILQQVMGAAERGFGIDNPFLLTNRPQEGKKCFPVGQGCELAREDQFPGAEQSLQTVPNFGPESQL